MLFAAGPMALIDRNFQGFGKELFTDAGKYVIHFGDKPMEAASQATKTIQAAHPDKPAPPVTAVAKYRNPDMQIIATSTADQLVCVMCLTSIGTNSTLVWSALLPSFACNWGVTWLAVRLCLLAMHPLSACSCSRPIATDY